ncbi:uncharacterized protein LOC129590580 [Paramacrobiotus metropolitanus]|uniref:uncharacterized protein LOC129590580 n=1 Tax=Paramacrobiotus metropolitanus TaxID=2943436 RepID=UPI0024462473|nr:uncharacterized protein LOC129590580 [Paramacrobiotus metropolitanus]
MGSFQIYLRCDSVDVWENSGLLRYGRVVDIADNGLFIDFLCPDRRCELTPFDRIFKMFSPACATDLDLGKVGERCPVEVLLRPNPRSPWTWTPAELCLKLRKSYWPGDVGVVQLLNAEGVADGPLHVVPPQRLRQPRCNLASASGPRDRAELRKYYGNKFASCVVRPGDFFRGSVHLTAQLAGLSEEKQRRLLNDWLEATFSDQYCGYPFRFARLMDDGRTWTYIERTLNQKTRFFRFANRLTTDLPWMIYKALRLDTDTRLAVSNDSDDDILRLPVEVLLGVFSHLDTVQQTRMRSVCSTWAAILESAVLLSLIVIPRQSDDAADYSLTATLANCLNSSTQRIIIIGGDEGRVIKTGDVIGLLSSRCGRLRLRAICFARLACRLTLDPCQGSKRKPTDDGLSCFAAMCSRLPCGDVVFVQSHFILTNRAICKYALGWPGDPGSKFKRFWDMTISTYMALARLDRESGDDAAVALWSLVETHISCSVSSEDRQTALKWLAKIRTDCQQLENENSQMIDLMDLLSKTLCAVQSARCGCLAYPCCRDSVWDPQLNNIAPVVMCLLVQFVNRFNNIMKRSGSNGNNFLDGFGMEEQ